VCSKLTANLQKIAVNMKKNEQNISKSLKKRMVFQQKLFNFAEYRRQLRVANTPLPDALKDAALTHY
jgi:hypothetical protein